jgi:predicted Rossmann fold nucleotide-binding protein DprA/Smf involved in DNA uptake
MSPAGELRAQPVDQARRAAGGQRGRCNRGTVDSGAGGATKGERPEAEQRNLLAAAALGASEKKLHELLNVEETRHIDEPVENSGLNSSEVLATLFDLEMKGVVRQPPGKQFSKVML